MGRAGVKKFKRVPCGFLSRQLRDLETGVQLLDSLTEK